MAGSCSCELGNWPRQGADGPFVVAGLHRRPHFSPSKEDAEFWPTARSGRGSVCGGRSSTPVGRPQDIPSCTDVEILLGLGSDSGRRRSCTGPRVRILRRLARRGSSLSTSADGGFRYVGLLHLRIENDDRVHGPGSPRGDGFVIYSLAIERCRNRSGEAPRLGDRAAVELLEPIFPGNGNQ